MMNDLLNIVYRKDTDDDRWVIPEVINQDMYCIKSRFAHIEPLTQSYVIDCGAHIGAFSIMCARHLKNVDVISFEPNPDSFWYLNENAKRFGKIKALNKAVSVTNGTLNLYSPDQSDWSGRWTSIPNSNDFLSVESVGLFSFINELDRDVFILKLDIEGYEEFLIEASKEEDLRKIHAIIIETHTDNFNHQKLKDYGYNLLFNPDISAARQFVYSKN
ncbi:FkbM family methyltransferase [Pedobacter panaciterrae]|uniref:FkbM family methyltransferase n=1 Tax=Pedobacter panaciterrae TaxID=363849 RepID=A0ABU8NJV3_9SPHI